MATSIELSAPSLPSDVCPESLNVTKGLPAFRAIVSSSTQRIRSYNGSSHLGPFGFVVSPDPIRYLQPGLWRLEGRMRIVNADKTKVDGFGHATDYDKGFCLPDGWAHSWIKGISLQVCNQVVADTGVSGVYYKSLLSKLLNYGSDAVRCHLSTEGWTQIDDEKVGTKAVVQGTETKHVPLTDMESGAYYASRKAVSDRFANSQWVTFSIALPIDELLTSRDWIPNVSAEIHISRQDDEFVVKSGTAAKSYSFELDDLTLVIRKVQPSDALLRQNNSKLERGPAIYPFVRWTINQVHIPSNVDFFKTPNLFANNIPGRVICFLVTQGQLLGSQKELSGVLKHHNLIKLSQKLNGVDSPAPLHFQWDAPRNNDSAFRSICDAANMPGLDRGCGLTRERWERDRFCVVISNHYDGIAMDDYRMKPLRGELFLELKFSTPTTGNLVLVVMGVEEACYFLTKSGDMIMDKPSI